MKTKTFFFARTIFIFIFTFFIFIFCSAFPVNPASAAEDMPRAQLDESERHFTEAYRRFLARDNWGALYYLDRALKVNTYLVDHYLMKGLVMNRTGDYGAGREAFEYYLEVRPMDFTASRILSYAITQQRNLQRVLSPAALPMKWLVSKVDMQNELDLGYMKTFNARGLGKVAMWGKSLCLADTMGDRVVIYRKEAAQSPNILSLPRPVAAFPVGDGSFYVVTAGGDIYYLGVFGQSLPSPELIGAIENSSVADAVMISGSEFAAVDSATREIAFYSLAALDASSPASRTDTWSPPDGDEAFFEPVGASPYGQWLAVADRGGGRIFFLNMANRREFFFTDVPRPRDVLWSAMGELFVINEDGDLFKVTADFRDGRVEAVEKLESGLTNGWALFNSPDGDVYCVDIAGFNLWKAVPVPDAAMSMGAFSAAAPSVTMEENRESFLLEATLSSPFKTYSRTSVLVAHAVWNDKTMPAAVEWHEGRTDAERKADFVLFNRPAPAGAVNPAIGNVLVESGSDVRIALPSAWSSKSGTITNIIIDSTVDMNQEDLNVLALFCMNNGVELDVWARSVPSVELARAAGLTGGKMLFSLINQPELSRPYTRMRIRIPLPQELSSSGYPGRSMLSLFMDVGLMNTRDWIPLWPDMFE